jgi:hypothetical protein
MPTNLTGSAINATYNQLLHVDGGPTATEKVVYSGTGVATALSIGTQSISAAISSVSFTDPAQARSSLGLGSLATQNANNVSISGGSISGVTFTGSFSGLTLVESTTLTGLTTTNGGNLRLSANTLSSTNTGGNIILAPNGTGEVYATKPFGYGGTGTGGAVTQLTSKSTGVTLDKLCGQITMNNAQLNRVTSVSFTLTNSFIDATDVVVVNIASGATAGAYTITVEVVAAGSCRISLHNLLTGSDLSEAVVLNFAVIKGVNS